jgi:hypothetical protein
LCHPNATHDNHLLLSTSDTECKTIHEATTPLSTSPPRNNPTAPCFSTRLGWGKEVPAGGPQTNRHTGLLAAPHGPGLVSHLLSGANIYHHSPGPTPYATRWSQHVDPNFPIQAFDRNRSISKRALFGISAYLSSQIVRHQGGSDWRLQKVVSVLRLLSGKT